MSFFSKALQGAEKFLEQVDEGVMTASKRIGDGARAVTKLAEIDSKGVEKEGETEDDEEEEEGEDEKWNDGWDKFSGESEDEEEGEDDNERGSEERPSSEQEGRGGEPSVSEEAPKHGDGAEEEAQGEGQTFHTQEHPQKVEAAERGGIDEAREDRNEEPDDDDRGKTHANMEDDEGPGDHGGGGHERQNDDRIETDLTNVESTGAQWDQRRGQGLTTAPTDSPSPPQQSPEATRGSAVTSEDRIDTEQGDVPLPASAPAGGLGPDTPNAISNIDDMDEESLRHQVRELTQQRRRAADELERMQTAVTNAEGAAHRLKASKRKYERKAASALSQKAQLEEAHAKLEEQLQSELVLQSRIKMELEDLQLDREELVEYTNRAVDEGKALRKQLQDVEGQLAVTRREKESMSRTHRQSSELVGHLEQEVRDLKSMVADAADTLDRERAEWEGRTVELEAKIGRLANGLLEAAEERELAQRREGEEREVAVQTLTRALNEARVEKAVLEAENERLREIVKREKQAGLATSDSARREATTALQELEREMNAHRDTQKQARLREELLESEAAATVEALALAERRAELERQTAGEVTGQLKELQHQLRHEQRAREEAMGKMEALQQDRSRATANDKSVAETLERLGAEEERASALEQTLREHEDTISKLRKQQEHARSSSNDIELAEMQTQVRSLADATLHKQSQLELLSSENRALVLQLEHERTRTREAQTMAQHMVSRQAKGRDRDLESGGAHGTRPLNISRLRGRSFNRLGSLLEQFDSLCLSLFSTIRRQPLLRMVFVAYFLFTHILTYIILHHASAEAHTEDAHSSLPRSAAVTGAGSAAVLSDNILPTSSTM